MTPPANTPSGTSLSGTPSPDWTEQAADTIEGLVGVVRDKATVPLRTAARALVYGIALSAVGLLVSGLVTVAAIRGLTLAVTPLVGHSAGHRHRVWVSYTILGGIFTLAGLFLLRRAESVPREEK